jgi:hypothetical protein
MEFFAFVDVGLYLMFGLYLKFEEVNNIIQYNSIVFKYYSISSANPWK